MKSEILLVKNLSRVWYMHDYLHHRTSPTELLRKLLEAGFDF